MARVEPSRNEIKAIRFDAVELVKRFGQKTLYFRKLNLPFCRQDNCDSCVFKAKQWNYLTAIFRRNSLDAQLSSSIRISGKKNVAAFNWIIKKNDDFKELTILARLSDFDFVLKSFQITAIWHHANRFPFKNHSNGFSPVWTYGRNEPSNCRDETVFTFVCLLGWM